MNGALRRVRETCAETRARLEYRDLDGPTRALFQTLEQENGRGTATANDQLQWILLHGWTSSLRSDAA
jgi:hypothetical protein